MADIPVFSGKVLPAHLASITRAAVADASSLPLSAWDYGDAEDVLSDETVAQSVADRHTVAIPGLRWDELQLHPTEAVVLVGEGRSKGESVVRHTRGIRVIGLVPFDGDSVFFRCVPSRRFVGGFSRGVRFRETGPRTGFLVVQIDAPQADEATVERVLSKVAGDVEEYLGYARLDVARWQPQISAEVRAAVSSRYAFHREIAELDARLGSA